MTSPGAPAIELDRISKVYPDGHVAVRELGLDIAPGETLVLVGTSGSGKTTTMKMINRLIEPTTGTIRLGGTNIRELDPIELRRSIGYVIQEIGLFPHMTVARNIALVPSLKGWPRARQTARVDELLELVGLSPEYAARRPDQLSGGQKQRVGVARALAGDPGVLLMDEPFGALDPITRGQLQDQFRKLQRQLRKTVVFVTHDMIEAIRLADRIAVMDAGRLLQVGPPRDILLDPVDRRVADLVGEDAALKLLGLLTAAHVLDPLGSEPVAGDAPPVLLDTSLKDVLLAMVAGGRTRLAVVDGAQRLCGCVTLQGLGRAIEKHGPAPRPERQA